MNDSQKSSEIPSLTIDRANAIDEAFKDWNGEAPEVYDWGELETPKGKELL